LAKRKILVVDDDPDLRRLMSLVLQMGGYEVVAASNGNEALMKVRLEQPNLVLLDIMMPEIDGFETCRRLRKLPEGARLPVIMLSAADQVTDKVKGLKVGANDYITKPADSRELIARIEAHLRPVYARPAHIVAVLGCKSGVGTTMLAINLAAALKQLVDGEVILVDWNLPIGDAAASLKLAIPHALDSLASQIDEIDLPMVKQLLVSHPAGIQVLTGGQMLDSTPLSPDALETVVDVASKTADHLVIDAGWAAEQRWILPLEIVDELLFVVTPEMPALRRAAIFFEWERQRNLFGERLNLITNRTTISGGIPVRDLEELLQTKTRARLPEDAEAVTNSFNQGVPVMQNAPRSALSQAIAHLAQEIQSTTAKVAQP
jgi:CheY-like chemotaxis protein